MRSFWNSVVLNLKTLSSSSLYLFCELLCDIKPPTNSISGFLNYIILHEPLATSPISIVGIVSIEIILVLHHYPLNLFKWFELEFFWRLHWLRCRIFFLLLFFSFSRLFQFWVVERNDYTIIFLVLEEGSRYLDDLFNPVIGLEIEI